MTTGVIKLPKNTLGWKRSNLRVPWVTMATPTGVVVYDEDRDAVDEILSNLRISKKSPPADLYWKVITPVPVRVLQYLHSFLHWGRSEVRDLSAISEMIKPSYLVEDDVEITVSQIISRAIEHSLDLYEDGSSVIGLSLISYILLSLFKDSIQLSRFLSILNWTIIDTSNATNVVIKQHLPVKIASGPHGLIIGSEFYLLEGMMVANTLYPEINYRPGLDDVALIAKYDSSVELVSGMLAELAVRKYRILVPGINFSGHYLNQVRYHNRRITELIERYRDGISVDIPEMMAEVISVPLQTGYIEFGSMEFLQGLLLFTNIIGVNQPWIRISVNDNGVWKPLVSSS